jgi:hypothetical protein
MIPWIVYGIRQRKWTYLSRRGKYTTTTYIAKSRGIRQMTAEITEITRVLSSMEGNFALENSSI